MGFVFNFSETPKSPFYLIFTKIMLYIFLTCVFPVFHLCQRWDRVFSARFQIVATNGALTTCC